MTTVLNVELKLTKEEKEKIVNECLDILNERHIEDFEKLKAEFEEIEDSDYVNGLILPAWKVYEIIDNHIKELKKERMNDICGDTRRESKS